MSWIKCSEKLPQESTPVNVVYVNHSPEKYYAHIKDKPFTATALYCRGSWFWYSCVCEDLLREYGENMQDLMDKAIEVIYWQPIPEPPEV